MTSTPAPAPASTPAVDVLIHNEGTIFLFELLTTQARDRSVYLGQPPATPILKTMRNILVKTYLHLLRIRRAVALQQG